MALPAIPTDFIAHWPGTISGSTLVEETATYPGTITGTATRDIGRVGEMCTLGTDSDAAVGDITVSSTGTISCFLPGATPAVDQYIYGRGNGVANLYFLVFRTTTNKLKIHSQSSSGNQYYVTSDVLPVGDFNHVAFASDGASYFIYVNGLPVSIVNDGSTGGTFGQWTDLFAAGYSSYVGGLHIAATTRRPAPVNRLKVFNRNLTTDEIKSLALERPTIPTANLVAAWNFADMAAGIVPDSAPGADGSLDGTATTLTKTGGKAGIGALFNGTSSRFAAPISNAATAFTMAVWIKPTALGTRQALFSDGAANGVNESTRCSIFIDATAGAYELILGNGTVASYIANAGAHGLVNGVWTHLAYTVNGTAWKIYENGVLKQSGSHSIALTATPSGGNATWGRAGDFNGVYFKGGEMSSGYWYAAELSQLEIALLATERQATPTLGLVSHWTMDDVQGTTLVDEMGANNGTIAGATQVAGQIGQALSFDGVSGHVNQDIPPSLEAQTISLSVLFKTPAFINGKVLISVQPQGAYADGRGVAITSGAGTLMGRIGNTTTSSWLTAASPTVSVDEWHHGVLTISSGTAYLYVDAVLVASVAIGTINWADASNGPSGGRLYFGGERGDTAGTAANSAFYSGLLDVIQVYASALSPLDILALANESEAFAVVGTVTESGSPVIRTLRVYNSTTGGLLATGASDADGTYNIPLASAGTVHVMAVGDTGEQTLVHGPVTIA